MKRIILTAAAALNAASIGCSGARLAQTPGTSFRDCVDCPTMVVVPAGKFSMGSPPSETGRFDEEGPPHEVVLDHPIAVSRTPITRAQYEAFARATNHVDAGACATMNENGDWVSTAELGWWNPGFEQAPDHPVVCVSWEDAQAYADWLSARTGETYRLLTEAEFEYVARAGSTTAFPWGASGDDICKRANSFDLAAKREHPDWPAAECDDGYAYTAPVDAFPANAFGLYGATGNVFQWTEDCWIEGGYADAPSDGSPGASQGCTTRVIRGGSWLNSARGLRAAMRDADGQRDRYTNLGIRVARAL